MVDARLQHAVLLHMHIRDRHCGACSYVEKLKPLSFREFDLMDTKARFHFRNQALASKSGQSFTRRHAHSHHQTSGMRLSTPCCFSLCPSSMSISLLLSAQRLAFKGVVAVLTCPFYMRGVCCHHTDVFVLLPAPYEREPVSMLA